jgi:hypothetical protein
MGSCTSVTANTGLSPPATTSNPYPTSFFSKSGNCPTGKQFYFYNDPTIKIGGTLRSNDVAVICGAGGDPSQIGVQPCNGEWSQPYRCGSCGDTYYDSDFPSGSGKTDCGGSGMCNGSGHCQWAAQAFCTDRVAYLGDQASCCLQQFLAKGGPTVDNIDQTKVPAGPAPTQAGLNGSTYTCDPNYYNHGNDAVCHTVVNDFCQSPGNGNLWTNNGPCHQWSPSMLEPLFPPKENFSAVDSSDERVAIEWYIVAILIFLMFVLLNKNQR